MNNHFEKKSLRLDFADFDDYPEAVAGLKLIADAMRQPWVAGTTNLRSQYFS